MTYFVTGATGFIGHHLVMRLAKRRGTIYVLVRKGSKKKLAGLIKEWGLKDDRVVPIVGDLTKPRLGVSDKDVKVLSGKVKHFFHLAAIYDMNADEESQVATNIEGTRGAVHLAEAIGAGCFHHTSSIATAGLYEGIWREDMFEEWKPTGQPYFRTKHESEGVVRTEAKIPWRVYRPGMVVGDSKTGHMDKVDGPYYFFKLLKSLRTALPPWVPLLGIEGRQINIVPVDYVVDAMDHLAHKPKLDRQAFHLTDPNPRRAGEVMNLFAEAAGAPRFAMRIDSRMFNFVPASVRTVLMSLAPVRRIVDTVLKEVGVPRSVIGMINYPTKFDAHDTVQHLKGSGIACPDLADYAPAVWDYWERKLDPDLHKDRSLAGAVKGKVVLITGGSSGIGQATALQVARAGAKTVIVARGLEKLEETAEMIRAEKGEVHYYSCDLADLEDIDRMARQVIEDHGKIDILVNNAGRSIRRSIHLSFDRFHDFTRLVELNYFGAIRMIMAVLPTMEANRYGQIINISSIGVLTNPPRFAGYVASKSALDAWTRCVAPEYVDKNVSMTTINMPLVRTPMIAPTEIYKSVPTISPQEAGALICDAMITRPKRVATRLGIFGQALYTLAPKLADIIQNTSYKLFPDSAAAKGDKEKKEAPPTPEAIAFATVMRGVHW